jgi:hypothetical protein
MIKMKRKFTFNNFKIVSGDDIIKYYQEINYQSNAKNSKLGNSCMKFGLCSPFLKFLSKNNVNLLLLMSENEPDKIKGRALLWDISIINNKEVNDIKFMDNIYTVYDYDALLFLEHAKQNGWLYKEEQNVLATTRIIDPKERFGTIDIITTKHNIKLNDTYPYLDTFKNLYVSINGEGNYLASGVPELKDGYDLYYLENKDGSYSPVTEDDDFIWVSHYNKRIHEADLVWCDFGEEYRKISDALEILNSGNYITRENLNDFDEIVLSKMEDVYLDKNYPCEFLKYYDDYVTTEYAEENLVYSSKEQTYLKKEDAVWSDYYDSEIYKGNSIEVITKRGTDNRIKGDKSYFNDEGMYYDKKMKKELV